MFRKDNLRLGLVMGLVAPFFGMLIFYFWKFYPAYTLGDFFSVLAMQKTLITGIVSFSLFINAVLLTIYLKTRRDKTAIGIFAVTFLYAVAALLGKWLG